MPIPKPPRAQHPNVFNKHHNEAALFTQTVRRWIEINPKNELRTHGQAVSSIVGKDHNDVFSRMKRKYKPYFYNAGSKFKLELEKIYEQHPEIWGIKKQPLSPELIGQQIIGALKDEVAESRKNPLRLKIERVRFVGKSNNVRVYQGYLKVEEDNPIVLPEGVRVKYSAKGFVTYVTVLEHVAGSDKVTFQSSRDLHESEEAILQTQNHLLIEQIIDNFDNYDWESSMVTRLTIGSFERVKRNCGEFNFTQGLDGSQLQALKDSLTNNLTYIWGPPGTGKSFLLARILLNFLFAGNEKTLVVSIANVAVDGLLLKLIKELRESEWGRQLLKEKRVVRLGYIGEAAEEAREVLPDTTRSEELRLQLSELKGRLKKATKSDDKAILLSLQDQIQRDLQAEVAKIIDEADIVFTTITRAENDQNLEEMEFQNLVFDEGGMINPPHLAALEHYGPKRIIVSGDFRQLGPIVLSASQRSERWLKKDLFGLIGENDAAVGSDLVSSLTHHRRCHPEIIELVNVPFYRGKLNPVQNESHVKLRKGYPFHDKSVVYLDQRNNSHFKVLRTASQSRINPTSKKIIINLIDPILKHHPKARIGIIAAYRGQVLSYRTAIDRWSKEHRYAVILAGTIHSFQGSEMDYIIWDMVDSRHEKIGNLYTGKEGERLVNVAISRAIGKLIVVGDVRNLSEGDGRNLVNLSTQRLMKQFEKFREFKN